VAAGVRKAPRHEVAGSGAPAVPRALFSRARGRQAQELAKLTPRSLSDQQRAELKKRFSKDTPPIRIVYRLMDGEGKDFSEEIASALRDAGGTVRSIAGGSLADLHGKVTVAVNADEKKTQQAADQLCDTLEAIHIPCGGDIPAGSLGGSPSSGEILLVVGRKD
jgi:hypothetical protein